MIAKIIHRLRFGGGAIGTGGPEAASAEATVSRILQMDINSQAEWTFHITDPLGTGIVLSPNQLPRGRIDFVGATDIPAPPPTHMNVKILSCWRFPETPCGIWMLLVVSPLTRTYARSSTYESRRICEGARFMMQPSNFSLCRDLALLSEI